jgi:hypothetical protein
MATTRKTKILLWVTALALVMACVPSLTTQSIPTIDPGAINTLIAQTANAALTQTAAALPSPTLTPFLTPTRGTDTPSPSPTSTVIFVFPTPTPIIVPTLTSASSSDNYACQVMGVSPPNGSSFSPRDDFDVSWTVKNIGKRSWDRTAINHVYAGGAKLHKISGYDLPKDVPVGTTTELGVDVQAPKDPGTYTTTWLLSTGNRDFCPMNFTIVVR